MVAVVSGNGLGLGNTSLNTLGSQGAVGKASEGQAGEQVYVNSSTGNLVIQDQDDYLAALGLDLPALRTYNSQGVLTDDLGGNWRMGVNERLLNLTGTVNTAGSTIVKVFGDESEIIYAYNAAQGKYVAMGQAGAHDELSYNVTTQQWTWVNGSTRSSEIYDSTGRLLSAQDTDGNKRTYTYTGSLLTQVTDASGQTANFDYTGNNLTQIWVKSQGQIQTLTHYVYDSQNRLSQVKVDLSPQDNSISDGNIYTTTYTYDGVSSRILSISSGDGTSVSFTYEQANGVYRVKTYATNGQVTTLSYTSSSGTSGSVTASANAGALTTTSTSNQTYNVNSGALSTTDTVNQPYSLNTGALSGGGSGTINFVQSNYADPQWVSVDTVTMPFTSAQTAGDLNVVAIAFNDSTSTITSVTDSLGNVYTLAAAPTKSDGNGTQAVYYAKNIAAAAAGANTLTVTFSNPVMWADVRAAEYHGADLTNPLDGIVGATGYSLNIDSGALTTTNSSDLLIGAGYVANHTTGPGGQFTQRVLNENGNILEDRTVTSTGSYDATAPLDGAGWWIMQLAAFKAASSTAAYYAVPSGATWQSIANTLYGVNSAAAGTALQTALGNPTLTAGVHLTGLPATLNVPATQTVPAYYTIPNGATWQSIANALYGVNSAAAAAALQTAMGNPTLTAGNRLTGLPSTLTVSSTVTVPAYYLVPASATWASITLAVYGTNDANATLALQAATGAPALSTGLHLTVPSTISYVPATSSTSAPANTAILATTDTVNQPYSLSTGALSGGGSGTINFVQSNYADPQWVSVDTVTMPFTSAQTAGDLNVVAIAFNDSTSTITSVTDSLGNVYTLAAAPAKSDGNGTQAIYYAKNIAAAAAGANTLTVTFSNPVMWADVRAAEYHGADLTNPLDGIVGAAGNSLNMDSGALTTTNASDLLVGASYVANHTTGPGSQFTQRVLNENGNILEDRTVTSTGSYDATAPLDGAGWWIMQLAAFKAASSAAAYYVVPSGATWQSIANALYGVNSAAAGAALQTAMGNPALTAGAHLTGLPATLNVPISQTVPAYYTVPAGATWSSIAQAVYGTSDANAIAALQVATGNPALSTGLHLVVPSTLTYSPAGTVAQLQTDITDALGKTTTYFADSSGRLTSILSPAMGGARLRTDYTYDANGNITSVVQDPSGLNRVTTLSYDANGNLLSTRDALGDTVTRTYSSTNKVLTETHYLTPDPDGAGSAQPASPVTTRYAYDSEDHLRFSVSSDGRVTEYRYNSLGQQTTELRYTGAEYDLSALAPTDTLSEAQLATWAAARDLKQLQRTDYIYDVRGNLSTATVYAKTDSLGVGIAASTSITQYVYDQHGLLLQTIDPRAASTSVSGAYTTTYVYDGLGRNISTTEWIDGSVSNTTLTSYDAVSDRTTTTLANGLISTSIYDSAGRLTSVIQSNSAGQALSTATYSYDADGRLRMTTETAGVRQYVLYDEAGRKVADIDGTGALTQYVYDAASEVIKTVRYADALNSAQLASLLDSQGNPANVSLATLLSNLPTIVGRANDQITRVVYDAAGRKQYSIDAVGDVTKYVYDGENRLTEEVQYATAITIAASVGQVLPSDVSVGSSPNDRHTRNFYDNDGHLTGTLDAAGYLIEYSYDGAGQLVKQTAYAKPANSTYWQNGTLDQLRPAPANTPPDQDITSYFFYDGEGRQTGALDGEGYLTETVYDPEGNVSQQIRYDKVRTYSAGATVDSLRPTGVATHTTSYRYDGENRLIQKTDYEGTVQTNKYTTLLDAQQHNIGNLLSVTNADGTSEARTVQQRYDSLGRVTAQLSAQGSALITAGMTQTQIEAIWNQYAVHYAYDLLGRKISATDQNNNTTLFFYDADGRQVYSVNAAGEVQELRYNALGQLTDLIQHVARIATDSLSGGSVTATLSSRVSSAADPSKDAHTTYTYKITGRLASEVTVEGASVTHDYNAFGNETTRVQKIDASRQLTLSCTYDARGLLLTQTQSDPSGLNVTEGRTYDAFGRLTKVTDGRLNTRSTEYDRLGRIVATVDELTGRRTTTYDAFSRTLTTTDALTKTTQYTYDDVNRSVTVTTPEGIIVKTVHNRHGQTLSVIAGGNTTTYGYDANGALQSVSDSLGSLESRSYDAAGRELTDTDALGTVTTFTYDAANRILTRTVDSGTGGLRLTTTYTYDGEGRVTRVVEPNGRTTDTAYDRDGRITLVTVDPVSVNPNGLNLRTQYTYDLAGHVLIVTEGYGSGNPRRTQYVYDVLGRRTDEYVDPTSLGGTLNLHTQYKYDANGNLTRKIDASGASTWYVYDTANRLHYTVDALGGVTETTYDAENRIIGTRRYATAISTKSLGDVVTSLSVTANAALDRFEQNVYDKDGRAVYSINAMGGVTERQFDALGNVTREVMYAKAIAASTYTSTTSVVTALNNAGNTAGTPSAADHVKWTVSDVRSRTLYTVDGSGAVVRNAYDAANNLVATRAFTAVYTGAAMDLASLQSWGDSHLNASADRVTYYWYDTTGRLRFTEDAEGYLHETRYDDAGRQSLQILYAGKPSVTASSTLAQVVSAAQAAANSAPNQTQTTTSLYDAAGRLVKVTDSLGNFETYGYDAVGNKTSFTNKKNATWTYEYDANHRLIFEHSPAVAVTTVTESNGALSSATNNSLSLVTHLQYDALGNVRYRTEAYGTSQARTTEYQYDTLGRQIKTIFPPVGVYSAPSGDEQRAGSAVVRVDTTQSLSSEVAYDTLGNAYRSRDVAGNYSFKVYDALGRVQYEVDAENYLTQYGYDVFGNQTQLTRYANRLNNALSTTSAGVTASDVTGQLNADTAADRTVTTRYDRLSRKVQVTEPAVVNFAPTANASGGTTFTAGATTFYAYDAFGDVVRESHLVNPLGNAIADPSVNATANSWAHTYSYYDRLGNKTAQVDALGYLTTYGYDQAGNLTRQVEYATPLAAGWTTSSYGTPVATTPSSSPGNAAGYDRDTRYGYDQLNRKTSQTLVGVEYTQISGTTTNTAVADQLTTYAYDALGNQTSVTNAAGASTYTYYDVLGRVIAIAEPQRVVDGSSSATLIPLTEMRRDAFGNLVEQVRYANGAASASVSSYTVGSANSADRDTKIYVDAQGHALHTLETTGTNTAGIDRYASYNARGEVAKEWQYVTNADGTLESLVTIHQYDKVGRETAVIEPQSLSGTAVIVNRASQYNAFGEITAKGVNGGAQEYFDYDQAGHLWRTNSGDGVNKVYLYDLAGHATVEIRSKDLDLKGSYSSGQAVNALTSQVLRTETRYDLLGRVVEQRLPTFSSTSGLQAITSTFSIGQVAGPANPSAIYQLVTLDDGAGPYQTYVVNPMATLADGGGYYLNASGAYVQDPNHQIVTAVRVTWDAPTDASVEAKFEYRVLGSTDPNAWAAIPVGVLDNNKLGANVSSLLNQTYEYRVTYRRRTDTTAYAEATGTFQVTGTTSTTLSISQNPVDPASEVATLATTQSNGIVSWTAPSDTTVTATLRVKVHNTSQWTDIIATRSGSNFQANAQTALASVVTHDYDYEIDYVRDGNVIARKTGQLTSTGASTPRIGSGTVSDDGIVGGVVTAVATPTGQVTGTVGAAIQQSEGFQKGSPGSAGAWSGQNVVNLSWANIGSAQVKVEVDYLSAPYTYWVWNPQDVAYDPAQADPTPVTNKTFTFSSGATGVSLQWAGDTNRGVSVINAVRVYTLNSSGVWVIQYSQANPTAVYGRGVTWDRSHENIIAPTYEIPSFEYAVHGSGNWLPLPIIISSTTFGIDLNSVLAGNYDYRIRYRVGNRIAAEETGSLTIANSVTITTTTANVVADSPPAAAETVATVTANSGSTLSASITSSMSQGFITGNRYNRFWSGTNGVSVSWTDLGSAPVRVELDYVTQAGFHWEAIPQDPGSYNRVDDPAVTVNGKAFTFSTGGTGQTLSWSDDPASVVAGIAQINAVRVYARDASGNYTVLVRSLGVTTQPSLTWAAPASTTSVTFGYRVTGSGGAYTYITPSISGSQVKIDLSSVAAGNYEYYIGYRRSSDSYDASGATGTFSRSGFAVSMGSQTPFNVAPSWLSTVSQSGSTVTWTQLPASNASVVFEYWNGSVWSPMSTSTDGSGHYSVNFSGFGSGTYSYRIRYTQANASQPYIQATGKVTVNVSTNVTPASVTATVGSNQTYPADHITGVTANGDGISWSYSNTELPSNSTIKVRYWWYGSQVYTITLPGTTGAQSVSFSQVPEGLTYVSFDINYYRNNETDGYARGGGQDVLTISYPVVQPTITISSQADAYPSGVQQIAAPTYLGNNVIGWTTPAENGSTAPHPDEIHFLYQSSGGGNWTDLTVKPNGSGYTVDLSSVAGGVYKYQITYTRYQETNPYAGSTGSLTVTRTTTISGFTSTANPPTSPPAVNYIPTTLQTFDRWGNAIGVTDAALQTTNYRYNQLGSLIETKAPTVDVTATAGGNVAVSRQRPVTSNYYDLLGRLIAIRDADGNLNQVALNAAGETLSELHADTGVKSFAYNAFGNQTLVTNELGFRTWNVYDGEDHLTSTTREVSKTDSTQNITENYGYDTAGRRITDTIVNADNKGNDETTRYFYDLNGNLIKERTPLGRETSYTYDTQGYKTGETNSISGKLAWTYDYFGHLGTHIDLGNVTYTYTYNSDGLVKTQTSNGGQNIGYVYDEAGQLTQINDSGVGRTTTYTYDSAGRRAREKTVINGLTYQDTAIAYDELGRIKGLTDLRYALTYRYDAQGNRTDIATTYYDHQQLLQTQDLWYTYDSMNRVLISQGINTLGSIDIATPQQAAQGITQGIKLTYNVAGERTSATTYGHQIKHDHTRIWNKGILDFDDTNVYVLVAGDYTEQYTYDGVGRLTTTTTQGLDHFLQITQQNVVTERNTTPDYTTDQRTYDHASRELTEVTSAVDESVDDFVTRARTSVYDHDSHLQSQTTTRQGAHDVNAQTESVIGYVYDAAGVLRSYTVQAYNTGTTNTLQYTSYYGNLYHLGDTYQDAGQSVSSVGNNAPPGSTTRNYNADGELVSFTDSNSPGKDRYFANNASGQALTVVQGNISNVQQAFANALARSDNGTRSQYFFFANGQAIGSFGQLTDASGKFTANFDVNYTPVSSDYPASVPTEVVAQEGDTLRRVAARVFGDATLWYLIADENGLTDPDAAISAGTVLRMPNSVVSLSNSSSSFKPFNASQAIGDTTPTQPIPPPPQQGGGCGVFGQILEIAVAIVVTYFTAGALTGTLGPVLAGAIGGAAGSIASQTVAIADGDQKGFSWKGVAEGALMGAVGGELQGAGIGKAVGSELGLTGKALQYGATAIDAAASSVLTQGLSVATGLQKQFSWSQVAVAAVAAPLASAARGAVSSALGTFGQTAFGSSLASNLVSGVTHAGVEMATGGKVQMSSVLVDAFANAIGDSIVAAQTPNILVQQQEEVFAQIAAGAKTEMDEFDTQLGLETGTQLALQQDAQQIASNTQAYFDQQQSKFADAQQLRILANDSQLSAAASLNQSFQSSMAGLQAEQFAFPEESTAVASNASAPDPNTFWGDHVLRQQLSAQGLSSNQIDTRLAALRDPTASNEQPHSLIDDMLARGLGHPQGPSVGLVSPAEQAAYEQRMADARDQYTAAGTGTFATGTYLAARGHGIPPDQALQGALNVDSAVAAFGANRVELAPPRPAPRQSELDVTADLGPNFRAQVSYKGGADAGYGETGSVRPDNVSTNNVVSIEVKNYNLTTNADGLINNVAEQAITRSTNLPAGMQQFVVIDARGQTVSLWQMNNIINGIAQKSNYIVPPSQIAFKVK